MESIEKPRIGHINFLNVLPLTYSYAHGFADGLQLTEAVPAELNQKIRAHQLDISAVSSIVYARNAADLLIMPDICIRSDADVESIVLVSRKPAEGLDGSKIILTAKSETSHCLLKIILHRGYSVKPSYEIRPIGLDDYLPEEADAALLIGDDALHLYHNRQPGLYYYDLGREWHTLTGHSMVYAVWAVQKDFAADCPHQLELAHQRIVDGLNAGLQHKDAAINSVFAAKDFAYEVLDHYLGGIIHWDLTAEHLKSLQLFYRLAFAEGLIPAVPEIKTALS